MRHKSLTMNNLTYALLLPPAIGLSLLLGMGIEYLRQAGSATGCW